MIAPHADGKIFESKARNRMKLEYAHIPGAKCVLEKYQRKQSFTTGPSDDDRNKKVVNER